MISEKRTPQSNKRRRIEDQASNSTRMMSANLHNYTLACQEHGNARLQRGSHRSDQSNHYTRGSSWGLSSCNLM